MDFSGDVEAEDALASPATQAETRRVAPRLVLVAVVLPGEETLVLVATGSTIFFLTGLLVGGVSRTHGVGSRSRRMGRLSGLGTTGYER